MAYCEAQRKRREAGLCPRCGDIPRVGVYCLKHWFAGVATNHGFKPSAGEELETLWIKQDYQCAYTGELLVPGDDMSLDHIVPPKQGGSKGIENVHWVLYRVNRMKNDMLEVEFFRMCRLVLERQGYFVTNRSTTCQ